MWVLRRFTSVNIFDQIVVSPSKVRRNKHLNCRKPITKIKKKQKPKPFALLIALFSQIVRAGKCKIKTSQAALCKLLKHRHLEFMDEH